MPITTGKNLRLSMREHVAAAFQLVGSVEQVVEVEHQALGLVANVAQQAHARLLLVHRGKKHGQQHVIHVTDDLQDLIAFAGVLEGVGALVTEPQAEIRGREPGQVHAVGAHGQVEHQAVFPVQQGAALTLALGADVLQHREQPVAFLVARVAVMGPRIGVAHDFHGQVHGFAGQAQCLRLAGPLLFENQLEQQLLQVPRTTEHQVQRHVDARMHFPTCFCRATSGMQSSVGDTE
ncbi:hypothetical protein NWF32_24400 [Pseudomonas qingdaonensis]|nr:hypothetical protein [Pseudomonas qingdaonensis]